MLIAQKKVHTKNIGRQKKDEEGQKKSLAGKKRAGWEKNITNLQCCHAHSLQCQSQVSLQVLITNL